MRASIVLSCLAVLLTGAGCSVASDEAVDEMSSAATAIATAKLDRDVYAAGQTMTLTVTESYAGARTTKIADTGGQTWTKKSDNGPTMTWTAVAAAGSGAFTVTATITPSSGGAALSASDTYTRGTVTPPPPPPPPPNARRRSSDVGAGQPLGPAGPRIGPGLQARRLFFSDFNASLRLAQEACDAGMYPILSFKTGSHSWSQVAAGAADAELRALATRVNALSCDAFVAIHHEPAGDGQRPIGRRCRSTPCPSWAAPSAARSRSGYRQRLVVVGRGAGLHGRRDRSLRPPGGHRGLRRHRERHLPVDPHQRRSLRRR